jgi:hypothetical protein
MSMQIPGNFKEGQVIQITRPLRKKSKDKRFIDNLFDNARDLVIVLAELDRLGFDAHLVVTKKRGRPSNVSRYLKRQQGLFP